MTGEELPRSAALHPPTAMLERFRPHAERIVRRRWDIRVHGDDRVPLSGGVILTSNHIGLLDGPLLAVLTPRPVHALTKREMFEGRAAAFLSRAGQIPVDRQHPDPAAIRTSLRVIRDGGALGIFPEGTRDTGEFDLFRPGAAYLALVTGAPVVPVTWFGTRLPGSGSEAVPPRRTRIDVVYGEPWRVPAQSWPRRREQVRSTATLLREHLRGEVSRARALTGRDLPGPLPAVESDDDPQSGFVKRGTP